MDTQNSTLDTDVREKIIHNVGTLVMSAQERMIVEETQRWYRQACEWFHLEITPLEIEFYDGGRAAGRAHGGSKVRFNLELARTSEEAWRHIFYQTIPHEVAHVIAFRFFPHFDDPHGVEWQAVMKKFGLAPEKYHALDVSLQEHKRETKHESLTLI